MENNSIKDNLSREDIISDIILSMGADIEGENVYLIVEGDGDVNLLRSFLSGNVNLYESYGGKNGVEFLVVDRFGNDNRVIGIRDKDYQLKPTSDKMFYYDYGCMEMMLISNKEVFGCLCDEYYKGNKLSEQLRQHILSQLKLLSIIRLHNERDHWEIRLNAIPIDKAWNGDKDIIDNNVIINKINSMNKGFLDESKIQQLNEECIDEWDEEMYYNNTQGHDFFMLFASICNYTNKGKKGISHDILDANARCTFRLTDLIETKLYRSVIDYGKKYDLKIMKTID